MRKRKKSLQRVMDIVVERLGGKAPSGIAIIHAQAGDDVPMVEGWIKERLKVDSVYSTVLTPVVGTHGGPGTLGIAFYVTD